MNEVRKVLVKGSLSYNLGDDMFIKILANRYPIAIFYLIAPQDYSSFLNIPNIRIIGTPINRIERVICKILGVISSRLYAYFLELFQKRFYKLYFNKVDAYIVIGGSLFKEARHSQVTYSINSAAIDLAGNKPSFILGANFGPYSSGAYLNNYRSYFSRFTDVCFRDYFSYNLFSDLNNVRVHKDIIFQAVLPIVEKNENEIGFVVVDFDKHINLSKYKPAYEDFIFNAANFYKNQHKSFCLIAFQSDEKKYVESLKEKIWSKVLYKTKTLVYAGDQDAFLLKYGQFSTIYSTRFHSMVLSFMYGQKNCPIIYNMKLLNFIHDINYDGPFVELDKFDVSDDFFLSVQESLPSKFDFSVDSVLQFEKLDSIIS